MTNTCRICGEPVKGKFCAECWEEVKKRAIAIQESIYHYKFASLQQALEGRADRVTNS